LGSRVVPVRLLPETVVLGEMRGVLLLPTAQARLDHGARPSVREPSQLNCTGGFSCPHFMQRFEHFMQRFESSKTGWAVTERLA
jgi:hypothetical protein